MAAIAFSWLPKVCKLAGTVLVGFGILELCLGLGPAGNHFCDIQSLLESLLGFGLAGVSFGAFRSLLESFLEPS